MNGLKKVGWGQADARMKNLRHKIALDKIGS
jgi:hypothetical protein